uniref:Uncharacterized protein n=1 Tax=Aegilops tauschii subsp. strangulata TaxID=200361 RepID=A0A453EBY4_AEGTS
DEHVELSRDGAQAHQRSPARPRRGGSAGDSPWRHLGVSDSEDMPGEEGQHHLGDVDGSRHLWRCSSCSRSLADGRRKPPPDCLHGGRWWSMVFTYLTTRLGSADRRL